MSGKGYYAKTGLFQWKIRIRRRIKDITEWAGRLIRLQELLKTDTDGIMNTFISPAVRVQTDRQTDRQR